jgi:hypothetical protein
MWIGGVDSGAEASAPAITPMNSLFPAYAVTVDHMAVGSGSAIGSASEFGPTIIDTGTSISFIPTKALASVTSAIQTSAGFKSVFGSPALTDMTTMGCVTTAMTGAQIDKALPPLHVAFPDGNGSDSPYVDLPATKAYLVSAGASVGGQNAWCYALQDSSALTGGQALTLSLFGDSLLNSYLAVFDIAKHQMQFAASKGCGEADAIAKPAVRAPMIPGVPWWQQDPRVRVPRPEVILHELAVYQSRGD